jgi:hypothetical protein
VTWENGDWPEFTEAERASLEQVLDAQRDTLLHKCSGLSVEQLTFARRPR